MMLSSLSLPPPSESCIDLNITPGTDHDSVGWSDGMIIAADRSRLPTGKVRCRKPLLLTSCAVTRLVGTIEPLYALFLIVRGTRSVYV